MTTTDPAPGRFVALTLRAGGGAYRASEWLPPAYGQDPARRWPLLVYLHSSGERGTDGVRPTLAGLGLALRRFPGRYPCVVALPHCPEHHLWGEPRGMLGEPLPGLVDAALDAALARHPIDPDRVVLTGISMGGYGTWEHGARLAGRLAGLMPICGGGRARDFGALCALPVWAHHGTGDDAVPVSESRRMWDMLREAGCPVRYTEHTDLGHACWDRVYADPEVARWLVSRRRSAINARHVGRGRHSD